jgi:hypothetical protein
MLENYRGIVGFSDTYTRAGELLLFGQLAAGFLVVVGLVSVGAMARRRAAGPAPAVRSPWLMLTSLPALFVLAVAAGVSVAFSRECAVSPLRVARGQDLLAGVAASAITALAVPLVVALVIRRGEASRGRVWLDSLGAGLPVAMVITALVYLGLSVGAMDLRARWVRQKLQPASEMEQLRRGLGPRWDNPLVRPGSYVESYPPPP